ncbi:MAG: ABC transporter permease [Candidatus Cloacimonetes bacterium]|nr:ABC transporter permease [Candidatus Cloacimonadota bacterium]
MFHLKLALRYLKGRKKYCFTFSNMLSVFGIIIGVFSLLVVSSVMNGFESDMRNRVIGSKAEIKIYKFDYSPIINYKNLVDKVSMVSSVVGAAPVCENELMIQKKNYLVFTICFGIDFEKHKKVTELLNKIVVGEPETEAIEKDGIIIGLDLSLTLNATVGEYVQLTSPVGTEPSSFGLLPRSREFKVIGIFISGMPEYDRLFTYVSLKNAQYFLGYEDEVSHIDIKTQDSKKSRLISKVIQSQIGENFIVEDWSDFEANLFNAIKMEKIVMFLVLALMIIIAAFNMTGNFIKLVAEKKTEIGILKAMGATEHDIIKIFVNVGVIIGIFGTFIGLILALLILFAQHNYHLIKIPVPGFPLHWIPVEMRLWDFIFVPLVAIIISFLTTLHPARRTVKIDPIKIIRD